MNAVRQPAESNKWLGTLRWVKPDSMTYGNDATADYDYDGASRLSDLDWNLAGSADDFSYDFTYSPTSQIVSRTTTGTGIEWSIPGANIDNYIANGLNQYENVDGNSVSHDANGNVKTDHRGRFYLYDAENRLRRAEENSALLASYAYSSEGLIRYH